MGQMEGAKRRVGGYLEPDIAMNQGISVTPFPQTLPHFKRRESHEHAHLAIVPFCPVLRRALRLHQNSSQYNPVLAQETPIFRVTSRISTGQPNGVFDRLCLIGPHEKFESS